MSIQNELDYANPAAEKRSLSWAGPASLLVALLLSPFVIIGGAANDDLPKSVQNFLLNPATCFCAFFISAVSAAGVIAYLSGSEKAGRIWGWLALAISILGWGGAILLFFALRSALAGRGAVGLH